MSSRHSHAAFLLVLSLFLLHIEARSQSPQIDRQFLFLSPRPDAGFVPPETSIILRPDGMLSLTPEAVETYLHVVGSRSGEHTGTVTVADDKRTIVFTPTTPFASNEIVEVRIGGGGIPSLAYSFRTSTTRNSSSIFSLRNMFAEDDRYPGIADGARREPEEKVKGTRLSSAPPFLPGDYPWYDITTLDNPEEGSLFIAPFHGFEEWHIGYALILDNDGAPLFYRRAPGGVFDLKVQPTGTLTYFDNSASVRGFVELDSTYTRVNLWKMKNGYSTDLHGLQLLPNGHALLMSYDDQYIDMSQYVPGGNPNALVTGYVIQEQDASHNVVFEWRSWDHFAFTDAADGIDLTAEFIDYVHGNAVEQDQDGNLLISSRHMDEVTKIDRGTGDIIWRLGGKRNQFTFIDDPDGFSRQHDIRRLDNGNISLFDNGSTHSPPFSRAVEYVLDEEEMTAQLVWEYSEGPQNFSPAMGNAQRLPNGNTMIGWGFVREGLRKRIATEVRSDGSRAFEIFLDTNTFSYRVFRFPWNGRSAAPYLWTEDRNNFKTDSVLLKMTVFGRGDIFRYYVYQREGTQEEKFVGYTEGNMLTITGLERGRTYHFRAVGTTAEEELTGYSEPVEFTVVSSGPVLEPAAQTLFAPPTSTGTTRPFTIGRGLINIGEEDVIIENIQVRANSTGDFVLHDINLPLTLSPGDSLPLTFDFTPFVAGRRTAELLIESNALNGESLVLVLSGLGTNATIDGAPIDFGRVKPGSTTDSTVTSAIRNVGTEPIAISALTISSPDFVLLNSPSLPTPLLPGDSLGLTVRFVSADTGLRDALLTVLSDGEPQMLEIPLAGYADKSLSVRENGRSTKMMVRLLPSPVRGEGEIRYTVAKPGTVLLVLADLRGNIIRRFEPGVREPGEYGVRWDGRNDEGEGVPAGYYVVRVRTEAGIYETSFIYLR